MPELISKGKVNDMITTAEKTLEKCFSMLMDLKHATDLLGDAITNFQPLLAECLYEMMEFYHDLQAEKEYIISQKSIWEPTLFKEKIAANAKYLNVVKTVIEIGKTLGDAFAWFFYRKNRPALDMHFEHPSTGLFPARIGGRGEIEFIKNNQSLDGLFVIYHGITDMLRVGDFSLYASGFGIVGVGELKSKQEGERLSVTASITSKINIQIPNRAADANLSFEERKKLLQKDFPSLPRQIQLQDELMRAKDSEHSSNFYTSYEYDVIDSLSPDKRIAINEDASLLLCASWSQYTSLFDVLFIEEKNGSPEGLSEYIQKLMQPESPYNEAIISEIDTRMFFPRMPILWWKINDKLCKDIYFKKVLIPTIFNPAKILHMFAKQGFRVTNLGRTQDIKLERVVGGKHMEFSSLQMFFDLISQSLMKTNATFSIAQHIIKEFESGNIPIDTKLDLHIHLNNFDEMPQ